MGTFREEEVYAGRPLHTMLGGIGRERLATRLSLDRLEALIDDFLRRGSVLRACPTCVKAHGYTQEDFIEGVTIVGSSALHARLLAGAATLSF